MEWLANTQKKLQRLTYYVSAVSMFVLIPIMLLTFFDAISRTIFDKPVPGAMEASSYMLVMMILLGLAYTQQVKGHPRVTILASRLPPHLSIFVEILVNLLCLGITGIIVYQGWVVAKSDIGKIVSDVLRIPQFPFRMLVPVGGGLLFLEFLVDFLAAVQEAKKRVSKK